MKKLVLLLLVALSATGAGAKVTLPQIIASDMVLQRSTRTTLWGGAAAGADVSVTTSWNGAEYAAVADAEGHWSVEVSTGKAGGPYTVTISDGEPLTLTGVMLGEVWICSGQSNMEMPLAGWGRAIEGSEQARADAANHPGIRLFTVPKQSVEREAADVPAAGWENAATTDIGSFSAVAWFFGRTLAGNLGVPVGLVNTSWGGSAIEAWMTTASIDAIPAIDHARAKSGTNDNSIPARLYNGMIAPIRRFAARGFIWYQGESNRHNAEDYPALQAAMVDLWRGDWRNERMPFYFVQLAPHSYDRNDGGLSLPLTVEAQVRAMEITPLSGMAGTTDVGDSPDIHPIQKRQVGERLAWMALANDYGVRGLPAPAPTYRSMKLAGGKIVLSFNNVGRREPFAALGEPGGFEIAADDGVFRPARAAVVGGGTQIEVWSDEVAAPVAVRYAFHNYVPEARVATRAGQPLVPFRTDTWAVAENRR